MPNRHVLQSGSQAFTALNLLYNKMASSSLFDAYDQAVAQGYQNLVSGTQRYFKPRQLMHLMWCMESALAREIGVSGMLTNASRVWSLTFAAAGVFSGLQSAWALTQRQRAKASAIIAAAQSLNYAKPANVQWCILATRDWAQGG